MPQPPRRSDSTEGLPQALVDLARAFIAMGEEIAGLGGVTAPQWAVLHQVASAGPAGRAPSELASLNRTSRANVTKLVARLVRAGHLASGTSPLDGRGKRLTLTAPGRRALERMDAEKAVRLSRVLGAFTPLERAALHRLARKLLQRLGAGSRPRPA